ncbi:MAG: hypothetical protein ABSF97_15005 [Candidatus Sulfotelmatobacter sp.]|jgi:hypothetical protein
MPAESIDYTPIIADLENKKAAIERTIALLRQMMTMGDLPQGPEGGTVSSTVSSFMGGEVPTGAFLGKSIIEATKLYLEIVKKKQTAKQIMDGLVKGGMESSRPKSFLKTVHSALTRARQAPNPPFVKVGMQWGLTSWFPKGISSGVSPTKKGKKTSKIAKPNRAAAKSVSPNMKPISNSAPKSAAVAKESSPTAAPPPSTKNTSPNMNLVDKILQAKKGSTVSLHEIAKETKMDVQNVNRLVNNLVRGHKAERPAPGKVRAVSMAHPTNGHAVA